ncbi:hypothetical protein [Pararhodobacter sp. SW119]|uniref:hypothetical protein n=1 Tax=Pararhodobacter sp. SW119 TaxID=2780075 RepID=UPI001ADF233B|nr:hypothetical protein [Pararhodobacter sp. SW119]
MFDTIDLVTATAIPAPIQVFMAENMEGIVGAATMLGGRRGRELAQSIIERLAVGGEISASTVRALEALRALLALDHVHDDSRDEAGFFAMINPDDPVVEELCLLTDGYTDALDRSGLRIDPRPQKQKAA